MADSVDRAMFSAGYGAAGAWPSLGCQPCNAAGSSSKHSDTKPQVKLYT